MKTLSAKALLICLCSAFMTVSVIATEVMFGDSMDKYEFLKIVGTHLPTDRFCSKDLPQRPQQTPVMLLGKHFRNPLQAETFKLMLANLPLHSRVSNQHHALLFTNKLPDGLGDYSYIHKVSQLVQDYDPALKVDVMAEVYEDDIAKLTEIFQGDYQRHWAIRPTINYEYDFSDDNLTETVADLEGDEETTLCNQEELTLGSVSYSSTSESSEIFEIHAGINEAQQDILLNTNSEGTVSDEQDDDEAASYNGTCYLNQTDSFSSSIAEAEESVLHSPTYSNISEVKKIIDNSGFTLFLAAPPDIFDSDPWLINNNGFYIGEIINDPDRLMSCNSDTCRRANRLDFANVSLEELILYEEQIQGEPKKTDLYTSSMLQVLTEFLKKREDDPELIQAQYTDEALLSVMTRHNTCSPTTHFTVCEYVPRFGFGLYDIGFIHDKSLAEKPLYSRHESPSSWLNDLLTVSPDLLEALTGKAIQSEAIHAIAEKSDYYLGYMKRLPGQLSFIQSIGLARSEAKLTFVMPISTDDLQNSEMVQGLKQANIATVKLWSTDNGWQDFVYDNDQKKGRTITIINPYPLPQQQLEALTFFANSIVGSTGDHSMFSTISMGKLPFQETVEHQPYLKRTLLSLAEREEIKAFYRSSNPSEIAESIVSLEANPVWIQTFTQSLIDQYSSNELITQMIETGIEPSQAIKQLLSSIDALSQGSEIDQEVFIQGLGEDEADIARLRLIFNHIKQREQATDYLPLTMDKEGGDHSIAFLKKHRDSLNSSYLQYFLNEVIRDFTIKFVQ
ncbi:hypothetical protein [Endozoicomonas numazuensis]|nr:hypothetical protein [Endozoicomonas numazuensis]